MGRDRASRMPDEQTLRTWHVDEGRSFAEMVQLWEQATGETVTPHGLLQKCKRYDWYVPRNLKHSGSALLPWTDIRTEHAMMHDPSMLRKEHARRMGKVYSEKTNKRIDAYLKGLIEDHCVVEYRRDTIEGFHHVPRLKTDTDFVRLPEGYEPPATT